MEETFPQEFLPLICRKASSAISLAHRVWGRLWTGLQVSRHRARCYENVTQSRVLVPCQPVVLALPRGRVQLLRGVGLRAGKRWFRQSLASRRIAPSQPQMLTVAVVFLPLPQCKPGADAWRPKSLLGILPSITWRDLPGRLCAGLLLRRGAGSNLSSLFWHQQLSRSPLVSLVTASQAFTCVCPASACAPSVSHVRTQMRRAP